MNNRLKKDTGKQKDYQKKYMAKHQMLCINLDKKEDKDIIRWLNHQENKSKAVRRALRESITLMEASR